MKKSRWLLLALVLVFGAEVGLRAIRVPSALLRAPVQSISLLDRTGIPLREARVEERFSRELTANEIPTHVANAVFAAEDKRFYRHHGVDWLATARALANGLTTGQITSGASTITQQLIKISAHRPRTLSAKLMESLQALRLEQLWSKEKILCAYLNRVDFGNLNIGLVSAADYYFGKPIEDLSDAEAAFLAGLPRNPRKLNPHLSPERAQHRQQLVLQRLRENDWLDSARFERAKAEALQLRPPRRQFRAPHFVDLVLQQLEPRSQGAIETTTLDLRLNEEVERILRERLAQLREHNVHNGAVVVIDNASGDVIALVGSANYFSPGAGQVNGAWARRSAGSTLKPFTYLLALERGATPASMVADVRTSFAAADGFYRPENYNRRCYGPVTYRTALGSSLNIPAVKTLLAAGGPAALHERLRTVGLTTLDHPAEIYGLGLTLGNCEARLLELTNAYASLARLGEFKPWRVVAQASSLQGINGQAGSLRHGVARYSRPEFVWQIADIMSDNAARTLAFGINSSLRFDFPVACKTGTSTDFRDNWTIGFTREFSVGVWVGNFDGEPMREVSGVTGAGPILHGIFEHLHAQRGTSWYARPAKMVERNIHPLTGKLLADDDPRGTREKFVAGNFPPGESRDDYDEQGRVKLPNEYSEWFASAENVVRGRAVLAENSEPRIESPLAESVYVIDPDIPSTQRIPLQASGKGRWVWRSESLRLTSDGEKEFALGREGEHRISLFDPATGRRTEVQISVRQL